MRVGSRSAVPSAIVALAVWGCGSQTGPGGSGDAGPIAQSAPTDTSGSLDGSEQERTTHHTNQAAEAGFHVNGAAFGRGVAWVDVDGDGWEDLWQCDAVHNGSHARRSALYRNLGDGTFEVMDLGIDPDHPNANYAAGWFDYDNDGDPDLFLANGSFLDNLSLYLYRNDLATDGRMTDVSEEAGISRAEGRWWGVSFADYDDDSYLDVAVTQLVGSGFLFHNEGDGTFEDVSDSLGDVRFEGGKNPVWFDYDNDGDQDLYLAGMVHHYLFRNDGDDGFENVTEVVLDALPSLADARPNVFAAAAADFDQDGFEDLYLGRWTRQELLLLNTGAGFFDEHGIDVGLTTLLSPIQRENTMGLGVGDIDDEGWPDLLIGTGDTSLGNMN